MNAPPTAHPHIRSYSGRRGHFTSGQRQAYERLRADWCLPYDTTRRLDAVETYGRHAPLVVEIGFGMGEGLAQIAAGEPAHDFLGIEVYPAGIGAMLARIEARALRNVRLVQHDAVEVVRDMLAPDSIERVQVFFPDPWPKKRHHKRRLIQAPFVSLLASRIRPGGTLHCATDWENYAVQMLDVLGHEPLLENAAAALPDGGATAVIDETTVIGETAQQCRGFAGRPDYRPLTRFENRGLRLGHGVWDLVFRRR